jgi:hypothetical protein
MNCYDSLPIKPLLSLRVPIYRDEAISSPLMGED